MLRPAVLLALSLALAPCLPSGAVSFYVDAVSGIDATPPTNTYRNDVGAAARYFYVIGVEP